MRAGERLRVAVCGDGVRMSRMTATEVRERLAEGLSEAAERWRNAADPVLAPFLQRVQGILRDRMLYPPAIVRADDIHVWNDGGCRLYYSIPRAAVLAKWFRRKRRSKTARRAKGQLITPPARSKAALIP